ncbi:hypothetical protein SAMN02927900_05694 [Rhizobium mongolense subsp. loessense]|uniref:Transposase n=1 Tax=Rhizobium mongolense subsp. loessense TaxID=158890 RepID=A0A1G4TVY6_9HYPH|nr:hypothetical protein SAMN02927900_05694 [Rhizobium mongolense subsp. loessense]
MRDQVFSLNASARRLRRYRPRTRSPFFLLQRKPGRKRPLLRCNAQVFQPGSTKAIDQLRQVFTSFYQPGECFFADLKVFRQIGFVCGDARSPSHGPSPVCWRHCRSTTAPALGAVLSRGVPGWRHRDRMATIGCPRSGGHIERLIGARMRKHHLLPGTMFGNAHERGEGDSKRHSALTCATSSATSPLAPTAWTCFWNFARDCNVITYQKRDFRCYPD